MRIDPAASQTRSGGLLRARRSWYLGVGNINRIALWVYIASSWASTLPMGSR